MNEVLSVDEVKDVVEAVGEVFRDNPDTANEPIPPFETVDKAKLLGALNAPFQSAFGDDIYETVFDKAAALFYFVAKDHAFENGNKRIAVLVFLYYLARNGWGLEVSARTLYEIAVALVESPLPKDDLVPEFAKILKSECIPFDEWLLRARKRAAERSAA